MSHRRKSATDRHADVLQQVRELTEGYRGDEKDMGQASSAFKDLTQLLLGMTVLKPTTAVRKYTGENPRVCIISAQEKDDAPLPLNDGRLLSYFAQLFLDGATGRLKVSKSRYQYQLDKQGEHWVFRYEYIRNQRDKHPAAHLHVRGGLTEDCLPTGKTLDRLHFPTHRVSLESVVRLLVDHFKVPCNEPDEVWRPALLESESLFIAIAHPPVNPKQGEASPL